MIRTPVVTAGALVLAAGVFSTSARAQDDEHLDYLQLQGTVSGELDGGGDTSDIAEGISLEAATGVNEIFFLRVTADTYNVESDTLIDTFSGDEGLDFLAAGLGVNLPLGLFGAYAQLNYERLNYFGEVGTGPGVTVGATFGLTSAIGVTVSARHGEPNFSGGEDIEYDLYEVDGMISVSDATDLVVSYQQGTLDTGEGDVDLNDVIRLGVRFNF